MIGDMHISTGLGATKPHLAKQITAPRVRTRVAWRTCGLIAAAGQETPLFRSEIRGIEALGGHVTVPLGKAKLTQI